jgi:hypothetical protein
MGQQPEGAGHEKMVVVQQGGHERGGHETERGSPV